MKKVLVVDDDTLIRTMITVRLTLEGFMVLQAGDGEEGLHLATSENPDLILLDIVLPKMDGLTVLKILREKEKKQTPVVIISTLDDTKNISKAMDHKVFRYVMKKDFNVDDLLKTVHFALKDLE